MGMYAALGISATGLAAERLRMDVIANNLANADSTNGVGDAYHRKAVTMAEASGGGAQFSLPRPAGLGERRGLRRPPRRRRDRHRRGPHARCGRSTSRATPTPTRRATSPGPTSTPSSR